MALLNICALKNDPWDRLDFEKVSLTSRIQKIKNGKQNLNVESNFSVRNVLRP